MNTDPADGRRLYDQLDSELIVMIASGVADPEAWFNASFTVDKAQRWDGLGFTAEGALEWIIAFRADRHATAAWARVGMDPVDPVTVAEALAAGLDPLRWQAWRLSGHSHADAMSWRDYRFSLADASAWVETGCQDPEESDEWTQRGFSPAAAQSWRTGIREVADIIGGWATVGFSPLEASLCRLVGVSAPPLLADRLPGDMEEAIRAGRAERDSRSWAVGYRRPR